MNYHRLRAILTDAARSIGFEEPPANLPAGASHTIAIFLIGAFPFTVVDTEGESAEYKTCPGSKNTFLLQLPRLLGKPYMYFLRAIYQP